MSTRTIFSTVARLVLGAACAMSASGCGGELLRTGRSPMYLVVDSVAGIKGGNGTETAFLQSDVLTAGGVINDNAVIGLHLEQKNPSLATSTLNSVTMTRYHVEFQRTDGRNQPGVDVPYGFDGGLSATISAQGPGSVTFEIVRHQMKLEPPLKNLAGFNAAGNRSISGLGFISTIARITLYGRDQNGNEVIANAAMDVHFADFADE